MNVLLVILYILLGILGLLFLALLLPVGVRLRYSAEGFLLKLILGPVRWQLLPEKHPEKKKKTDPNPGKSKTDKPKMQPKEKQEERRGGSLRMLLPYAPLGWKFLGDVRRSILMRRLELLVNLGGDDPCDLAIVYGNACGVLEAVMPMMHNAFRIRKENVQVFCDFSAESTEVYVDAEIVVCPARLLLIMIRYGWRALKIYRQQNEKGGAEV